MIFIESQLFEKIRDRYLDDDQYRLLQAALMEQPESGDLIRGSGGVRKVRWSERGKGKRGGLRVIYYWITQRNHLLFLTVYRKSEVADLSPVEIRGLHDLVKSLDG
jgi:mRNA-degrading endonuclease RelE of RelBE toxin-antitoxin system